MSAPQPVLIRDKRGDVGILTLNRPAVRNALNLELRVAIRVAFDDMDNDPDVLAVVLTGAGGTFCAGRDLKAAQAGEPMYADRSAALDSFNRRTISKPVIAAVEGYALAGGFELALACDLLVAAEDAHFGVPEVKRNLVAVGGALVRLPRRMPYHLAMEMVLTGDHYPASRLEKCGVVNRLASPGRALDVALELAQTLAANGPSAVRATKEIVRRAFDCSSEADALDLQMTLAEPALNSPDGAEGIAAFLDKRPPVWTDR